MRKLDAYLLWSRDALRIARSFYVANGLSAALGLLLISGLVHLLFGPEAGSAASVGVLVTIPPDGPAPRRGKFFHLLPAALIGLPLFAAVHALHDRPLALGLLLVPATFFAFLGAAWGKRGLPISVSIMFAMVFSMAVPATTQALSLVQNSAFFAVGAGAYLVYATGANALLNMRYRAQMLADTLFALARLMRAQAGQFLQSDEGLPPPLIDQLMVQQAALADQLQTARDIVLESPRTPRRQALAGMLVQVLEMRDHLLACELDLDTLKSHSEQAPLLRALGDVLLALADQVDQVADALLARRLPSPFANHRPYLATLEPGEPDAVEPEGQPSAPVLARGLANRMGNINDQALRLLALARGEALPDLAVVRTAWRMFVSPTTWSLRPALTLWRWDAPPLRHAIRAALAIAAGYLISRTLTWGSHAYWILLTIVVVLRGSLAQTLERRNARVAGTLVGCVLAGGVIALHPSALMVLVTLTLAQALAHAFAVRRYLVTAVSATVLGLMQAHLLAVGTSPVFEVVERVGDTLIGVSLAWIFSYLLPSWERKAIPGLIWRTLAAQARHARVALALAQLDAVDNEPELEWRLARREAYDSLSALVQATQRSLSEPRAVRPPLEDLRHVLAHSYQLLAQLTSVKTILMLRRGHVNLEQLRQPLQDQATTIEALLLAPGPRPPAPPADAVEFASPLPDPFANEVSPWVLRRLDLAQGAAARLREDADRVLAQA